MKQQHQQYQQQPKRKQQDWVYAVNETTRLLPDNVGTTTTTTTTNTTTTLPHSKGQEQASLPLPWWQHPRRVTWQRFGLLLLVVVLVAIILLEVLSYSFRMNLLRERQQQQQQQQQEVDSRFFTGSDWHHNGHKIQNDGIRLPCQQVVLVPRKAAVVLLLRHCEDGQTKRQADGSRHCNPLGVERSEYLASLFATTTTTTTTTTSSSNSNDDNNNTKDSWHNNTTNNNNNNIKRWPTPSHLYALSKGKNMRQYETLVPLAKATRLPIHMLDYNNKSISNLVSAVHEDLLHLQMCQETIKQDDNNNNNNDDDDDALLPPFPMVTVVSWKHKFIPMLAQALGCDHCPHKWPDDDFDTVWELHYYHQWENDNDNKTKNDNRNGIYVPSWHVYGTIVKQNFDSLAFAYNNQQVLTATSNC